MPKYQVRHTETTVYEVKARSEVEAKKIAVKAKSSGLSVYKDVAFVMTITEDVEVDG